MSKMKVRIAVAVCPDGSWNSCGFSGGDEDDMLGLAVDPLAGGEVTYWVTAEVDVPETHEVTGTAEKA